MAGVVVAPINLPVFAHNFRNRLPTFCQDIHPEQHRPQPVLFPDMVGAGAKAFLAAQRNLARIQQIAEKLPAGRRFVAGHTEFGRDPIRRLTGGHGTGHPGQMRAVAGSQFGVGQDHRQTVAGRDEEMPTQHHVAVAIAIRRGTKVWRVRSKQVIRQLFRIHQIGIGMAMAEILQRDAIHHRSLGGAQPVFDDFTGVGTRDRVHGVKAHPGAGLEPGADLVEIK